MPAITLPDKSVRRFDGPVTGTTVAESDRSRPRPRRAGDEARRQAGRSRHRDRPTTPRSMFVTRRDPEALELIRHDAAHVLAEAVQELYPGTQVTIGPAIDDGFYYDFARNEPFTPGGLRADRGEDARDRRARRDVRPRGDGPRRGDPVLPGQGREVQGGDHPRICRATRRSRSIARATGSICAAVRTCARPADVGPAFKLMKVAGAYWRGDHRNAMLSRIYGTAWRDQKELDAYLHMLEEAERRDHRRIGKEMDLFHLQEEAAGSVFWHPEGLEALPQRRGLSAAAARRGRLPGGARRRSCSTASLWERSGHWENFREHMFIARVEDEDKTLAVKPMNCPCHVQIFRQGIRSYRELPLRLAEFGSCHRYEPSGALHGIMRVRAFTQDDAHIFCTEEQIADEGGAVRRAAVLDLPRLRLPRVQRQVLRPAAGAGRRRRGLGPGRGRAAAGLRERRRRADR